MANVEKALTFLDLVLSVVLKIWAVTQIVSHVLIGR